MCGAIPELDLLISFFFFFQAEDGIRDLIVTGVQTCALPISRAAQPARKVRYPRHARGHYGKLDVRFHCGDSFVSAKKSSKSKTPKTIPSGKIATAIPTGGSPGGEFERAGEAADFVFSQTKLRPQIGPVLGFGLG